MFRMCFCPVFAIIKLTDRRNNLDSNKARTLDIACYEVSIILSPSACFSTSCALGAVAGVPSLS